MAGDMSSLAQAPDGSPELSLNRAGEVAEMLKAVESRLIPFIRAADEDAATKSSGGGPAGEGGAPRTALTEHHPPQELSQLLDLQTPSDGRGKEGVLEMLEKILRYSVNTWDQGFMDKLYAATNAVGVASELILSVLNTNVHVYQVSPVLTLIEKQTTRSLANLFGLVGPHAGGVSQPGGSASNHTSIVIARNNLFPETKTGGIGDRRFVLFTSAHGHYSVEKAAQMYGFGSDAVRSVPVDERGRMVASKLEEMVVKEKADGAIPFYVNATAGTTVLGSFDPFDEIADVCRRHSLWMHIDGSYGGPFVFNSSLRASRLKGSERADSIGFTPHKMLNVPLTCSFLLGKDMREFHKAYTLPAGYLFHGDAEAPPEEIYDIAEFTPQCGRKGDALKMFLSWLHHGSAGYAALIENAYQLATHLLELLAKSPNIVVASPDPLPCLQVCFYYAKGGRLSEDQEVNSTVTRDMAQRLASRGWMIDYAPGEKGRFFRVVVSVQTRRSTITGLVKAIEEVGQEITGP